MLHAKVLVQQMVNHYWQTLFMLFNFIVRSYHVVLSATPQYFYDNHPLALPAVTFLRPPG